MKLTTVACNNCGAPLEIPDDVKYVTCRHCQSSLAVHHTDSSSYTEKLDEIDARTERMAEQIDSLQIEAELTRLERNWMREKEQYMSTDKNGVRREPSQGGAIFGGVLAVGFGIFWTVTALSTTPGFAFLGVVFILVGIGATAYGMNKAKAYDAAYARYRRRRTEIIAKRNK